MGTFTLIPPMSLGNLNKAEKLSLLKRYMKLMPSGSDSESPDEISLLADSGVPALNISAEQVTRMNGIIGEFDRDHDANLRLGRDTGDAASGGRPGYGR